MSTLAIADETAQDGRQGVDQLAAVLCGSFHRDPSGLCADFEDLSARFNVLSPRSLDFVDPKASFVRLADEMHQSSADIEAGHLEAMRSADLVWLHAPDGYVGRSAAMELGYASAFGIPVFTTEAPSDEALREIVTLVAGVDEVASSLLLDAGKPGTGLARLQAYYQTAAGRRGWSQESPKDALLLLTEELGELARAIRKREGLARHHGEEATDIGLELADVQLYVVHLANVLGLDLSSAVTAKERVNAQRFSSARVA